MYNDGLKEFINLSVVLKERQIILLLKYCVERTTPFQLTGGLSVFFCTKCWPVEARLTWLVLQIIRIKTRKTTSFKVRIQIIFEGSSV